jgi:hypothetical protein
MRAIQGIKNWYFRNEGKVGSVALLAGFIFDNLTLRRVDLLAENLYIIALLVVAGIGIILINLQETGKIREKVPGRIHFWLIILLQFALGGLYSTFLVFYSRSATLATSWPFLALLLGSMIANEVLKERYSRLSFQVSVLFLSIFAFTIFFVPVLLHQIGPAVFLLSGLISLLLIGGFIHLLRLFTRERLRENRRILLWSIGGIFVGINLLYFIGLIPPIPLALKEAGIYRSITHDGDFNYQAQIEPRDWRDFFRLYQPIKLTPDESVYAFSAVFSPTKLNTNIIHEWQKYDEPNENWLTSSRVELPIIGGRNGGYRTYSIRNNLDAGRWRVNVKTKSGQLLGRIKFKVEVVSIAPKLITINLQ